MDAPRPIALVVVPDLMFQPMIAAAAARAGFGVRVTDTEASLRAALASVTGAAATIAVVDLHAAGIDTLAAIRDAVGTGARVLAFGRHTEPALLRAAREAGASAAVPRSQLVEELDGLLQALNTT